MGEALRISTYMTTPEGSTQVSKNLTARDFVSRQRTRFLSKNIKSALLVSIINSCIIWAFFSSQFEGALIHYWLAVAIAANLYRGYLVMSLPKKAISFSTKRWAGFVALTVLAGILWAIPLYMLPANVDPVYTHLIIFVVAGMTAAAAHSYATHPTLVFAFVSPALAILSYYYFSKHPETYQFIVAFLVLYFIGTYFVTRRASQTLTIAIRNQWESEKRRKDLEEKREQLRLEFAAKKRSEARQIAQIEKIRSFNSTLDQLFQKHALQQSTVEEFFHDCIKTVSQVLSVERVSIWSFTETRDEISCDALYQASESEVIATAAILCAKEYPTYFSCLRENRVIVASDAETDPQTAEFLDSYLTPHGIKSLLDAPIRSHDGVTGIICCESVGNRRVWQADEIGFLASVAQLISTRLYSEESEALNDELSMALDVAQKANKAKEEFMATMNHELRTPMNGVLGAANLLQQSELDEENRKLTRAIVQSGDVLMRLLNDMLDFSKLEAGKVELETVRFSINSLIEDAVSSHAYAASEKGLRFEQNIETPDDLYLNSDPIRIAQILHNLISNAVKFTTEGYVRLCVSFSKDAGLEISIEDTGIGIAENRIKEIFQPFYQAESSISRRFGGTGLGLTIVDRLVRAFNGTLSVTSMVDKGTTITLTLPVSASKQREKDEKDDSIESAKPAARTPGARVLLVDDNQTNLLVITAFLKKAGAIVTTETNGPSAIETFTAEEFDVVLMDIHMPEMDGVEAMNKLKEAFPERMARTPIIAITADAMLEQIKGYKKAGFDDHIAKPVNEGKLIRCLENNLMRVSKKFLENGEMERCVSN